MNEKIKNSLQNFNRAMDSLAEALTQPIQENRDIAGIIKNFEFVYELSWKVLKHTLAAEGKEGWTPREVFEIAYESHWILDPKVWPKIMKDRNLTVHTYDQVFAREMIERISSQYLPEFLRLRDFLNTRFFYVSDEVVAKGF